ncbi:uncharacterized protein HGUI_03877 [Hanseniaspora guilliermondii]|uniref:J domain-containing protein n=1 Tax=Hanseniaspora guilliermondii TaxID=56406 RepID=A0A1L0B776_9ASCO|nr:uncharacterized protein HGUI_03877 [Hanseniaspora guilliermondii]
MTPYQVLNVPDTENFDVDIAKRNYYRLCKAYHPDTSANKDEANEKFLMVKEAYSILKDPVKKKGYDRYGEGWKYEVPKLRALQKQRNEDSVSSMYGDEQAARDRNMDEETFWEYMNAATFSERARFNNRSYGNQHKYTSDNYEYNPLTLLPGERMSKLELALWISIVAYALYIFVFVETYNFFFVEDLEVFSKDHDIQALIRSELFKAYNNYDSVYSDAWSRIRRFLFQRSYENYRHAVNDDLKRIKLDVPEDDTDDQSVKLKKQIIQEIQHTQEIFDELKDEDIDLTQVDTYINSDSRK